MNIKIIRLVTGEDVIGNITSEDNKFVEISKSFVIIPTQSAPGQPVKLMLTPYMPYSKDDKVKISADKIITTIEPKDEILKSYQQNTSSIITGKPNLITESTLPKL
jgi:hypothetical protein